MLSIQSKKVFELAKTTVHAQMDLDDSEVKLEIGDITKKDLQIIKDDYDKLEEKLGIAFSKLSGENQVLVWGELKELNFEFILDGF